MAERLSAKLPLGNFHHILITSNIQIMKKLFPIILLFVFTQFNTQAQIKEGHASFNIQITSNDPEMESTIAMMKDPSMNLYFSKDKTRTELDLGMFVTTVITDEPNDQALILMDMMGMKMAVPTTITEINKESEAGEKTDNTKVTLVNETKKILGYKCKKAIITNEDGFEATYWYTEEIMQLSSEGQDLFDAEIPGFAMEFESYTDGINMNFIITEFTKGTHDFTSSTFSTKTPEGYKELTEEELKEMGM